MNATAWSNVKLIASKPSASDPRWGDPYAANGLPTILQYLELEDDARKTSDTLAVSEKQIETNEGRFHDAID